MKKPVYIVCLFFAIILTACSAEKEKESTPEPAETAVPKIVSLNGAITEILCLAGQEKNLVGTDVTSTYPASVNAIPKVGHTRNLQAEGIISLNPTLVLGKEDEIQPALREQLNKAGIKTILFNQTYSADGTKQLIREVCTAIGAPEKAGKISEQISRDISGVKELSTQPKVLFIYARGAGTLMVAGEKTQMATMIQLAGGENAATGFEDFKPLTPEALLEANPDIILMFSSGLESIEGENGLLQLPGIAKTNAGKNHDFIAMDGQFLSGFGPRMGAAVAELNNHFQLWLEKNNTAKN